MPLWLPARPLKANGKPAIDYPYNRKLSRARVRAIANLLVKYLGVPRTAITHLAGHGNVNQPYPAHPRSPKNRVVIITYTAK
jgi:outer membrane protein OmpA-like peptidoglycan-associated protein